MDKIKFMRLWDLYGGLLTDTQREITDLYFNLDLTVSEIAAEKGVSRQSVSDCLNVCKKELAEYERKLGHDRLFEESNVIDLMIYLDVEKWAEEFAEKHPEFFDEIDELMSIFDKDYDAELGEKFKKSGD